MSDVATAADAAVTETATPYESDRNYKRLEKRVQTIFKTSKKRSTIDNKYKELTDGFLALHTADQTQQTYAANLLAHLHSHVYSPLIKELNNKEADTIKTAAESHVKTVLETMELADSLYSKKRSSSTKLKDAEKTYLNAQKELTRQYDATVRAIKEEYDLKMIDAALEEVYKTYRPIHNYYNKIRYTDTARAYASAVNTALDATTVNNTKRAEVIKTLTY